VELELRVVLLRGVKGGRRLQGPGSASLSCGAGTRPTPQISQTIRVKRTVE
jgi:hypothetical protein